MAARPTGRPGGPPGDFIPQVGGNAALLRALRYLLPYRRDAAGAFISVLLVSAANLTAPLLIRMAIDSGLAKHNARAIAAAAGGLVGVAILRGLFTFLQGYLAERASQGFAYDMRNALFTQIEQLSFSYYDTVEAGQLLTRATSDVEQIRTFAGSGIVQMAAAAVMLIGSTVLLLLLNWRLALVSLTIIPAIVFLITRFIGTIRPLFGQVQQTLSRLNAVLQEDLAGLRVVRAFVREDYETARYATVNNELLGKNLQTIRASSNNFPFVQFFGNLGTLLVVWYGGYEIVGGQISVGELIAFNSYLSFLLFPILTIGFQAAGISRGGASALRVFEVLDAAQDVRDKPDAIVLPPLRCEVEFADVHFRYPASDRAILAGVSFVARPGQTVAILGTTGSGKSTLVNLVPRFYDVTGGAVKVDGHDVRDVTLASLRGQIGVVLQETLLFSGTVRENIAYGKPDATADEVEAAARAAQADGFIRTLPQGYNTVVGERGVGLSGGQRQRIAIARALLVNPPLLILDDSTSAVDTETEALIRQALDNLMRDRNRTVLVIAQRITTVRSADLILVLDNGVIAARGTHAELLRDSPLYNDILGSQIEGGQRADLALVAGD